MSIISRFQNLAGIITEGKEFSSDKNYADKSESELQACKKELKAIQTVTSKASFKWKDAQKEIEKVDAALAALKEKDKEGRVEESLNETAWDVFLKGKKIDTVFYDSDVDGDRVKRGLINHDGYDSEITVRKARKARKTKKLKEAKFDTIELRLPAYWASALVNGDTTGLEDEEEATMNQWIEWASEEYNINAGQPVDVSDEPEFASRHDASPDVLATDVLTYTYFVNESVNENDAGIYWVIQKKESAFEWDDIDQYDSKNEADKAIAKLKEKYKDSEFRIKKHDDSIKEEYESPKKLYVLKIAEPGSDKFGVQFSGTRKECADEWKDTKESWGKGAKHKIERHIEESVLSITEDDSSSSEYEWEVQGNYEGEWEAVTTETNRKDAVSSLKDYRENEKGTSFRIRRVKVTEATEGNMLTPRQKAKLMSLAKEYLEAKNAGFSENARQIFRGMNALYDSDDIFRAIDHLDRSNVEESAESIAAKIIQEVDGTKTPEVDYQNGPTENSGIRDVQKKVIRIPSDVRAEVNKRIRELNKAIGEYDEKGYNDKSIKAQAVECLEKIMDNLKAGDEEGVKQAQIYFGTLMSPLTDFFPPKLINWLANANNKLVKEDEEFLQRNVLKISEKELPIARMSSSELEDHFPSSEDIHEEEYVIEFEVEDGITTHQYYYFDGVGKALRDNLTSDIDDATRYTGNKRSAYLNVERLGIRFGKDPLYSRYPDASFTPKYIDNTNVTQFRRK